MLPQVPAPLIRICMACLGVFLHKVGSSEAESLSVVPGSETHQHLTWHQRGYNEEVTSSACLSLIS